MYINIHAFVYFKPTLVVFAFVVISRISKYIIADANRANAIPGMRDENHLLTCIVRKFVEWIAEDSRSTTRKKRLTRDKIFSISFSAYWWQIIKCTYRIITVFCDTNPGWKALVVSSDGESPFSPVQAVCLIEIDIFNADDLWITKSLAKIQAKTRKTLVSPFI